MTEHILLETFGNLQNLYVTKGTYNLTIFMKFLCKGTLKLRKIFWIFWKFSPYYVTQLNFHKMYLETTKL